MYILGAGRSAFLDFLRNLTPQALILAIAIVASSRLNLAEFDFSNIAQTLVFLSLVLLAGLAVWANCSQFLEKSLFQLGRIKRAVRVARSLRIRGRRLMALTGSYAWKRERGVFVEVVVVVGIVELGLVALFFSAATSANAMLSTFG